MSSTTRQAEKMPSLTSIQPCFQFSLAVIQKATKDFDDELVIGEGGFGKVYKGCIPIDETSQVVAIKRLDSKSNQGAHEFRAEIEMLSKLRHCHLVSLIGFCDDNKEMILVYAYMPNGTLYHHLHKAETHLNWMQRLKIAIGAGRGLDYLHTGVGTQLGVIHRDMKSSNILLDENWAAVISDFGLSKIGPTNQSSSYVDASVKGTFGYLDPEYFYTKKLTRKTDVYAFGVVLFELLSGRHAVDERNGEEQCSLVRWAQKCVKERKLDQMVDSNIRGSVFPKCLRRFAQIANSCVHGVPKERPSMTEVVASLQALLKLQKKYEDSAESSGITGFTWKIHKYLSSTTKQNTDQSGTSSPKSFSTVHGEMTHQLKKFTYDELRRATMDFGHKACLGYGTYKEVYKGRANNTGFLIAVKRLHHYNLPNGSIAYISYMQRNSAVKHDHMCTQLELLLKEFSHPNLVKLLGYCTKERYLVLAYEFMHKGNFQDCLIYGTIAQLPLVTKVKIAVRVARGIVFLHKTQDAVMIDRYWRGMVSESRLDRHKILLDEDFTAKLSDYDVTKLMHSGYPEYNGERDDYCFAGCQPVKLQTNLSGFTVVLAEVLTGEEISTEYEFKEIAEMFIQHGKTSLFNIAETCFEICNEVDSESKMLKIFEEYEEFTANFQGCYGKQHV